MWGHDLLILRFKNIDLFIDIKTIDLMCPLILDQRVVVFYFFLFFRNLGHVWERERDSRTLVGTLKRGNPLREGNFNRNEGWLVHFSFSLRASKHGFPSRNGKA